MTHSKFISLIISTLLIATSSCVKKDIAGPLDGKYTGQVLKISGASYNSFNDIDTTTREVSFEIILSKFKKFSAGGFQDCIGNVEIEGDEIGFLGTNCGCFCDCLPHIDCEGDIILGRYNFESTGDSLIMQFKAINTDTVELLDGLYRTGWIREEFYKLTRN